jgi:hypothetical protein
MVAAKLLRQIARVDLPDHRRLGPEPLLAEQQRDLLKSSRIAMAPAR